jgi:putative ABC transport system permease protein
MLGTLEIEIAATLASEPDKLSGSLGYGPRLMVSIETLMRTGLVQPGSLVRWHYRVALPGGQALPAAELKAFAGELRAVFPEAGLAVADRREPAPGSREAVERLGQFLTLVGLTSLLIGGLGIANAVNAYLDRKRLAIATLRALGATSRDVLWIYAIEVLLMVLPGIVAGLAAGLAVPWLVRAIAGVALPIGLEPRLSASTLALGIGYGLLVAAIFVIWPLGRMEHVRGAVLFRDQVGAERKAPRWPYLVALVVALLLLVAAAFATAADRRLTLYFLGGVAGVLALFLGLGAGLQWLAGRMPRQRRAELAIALRNIAGPGSLARLVSLSIGAGLGILVTIALVDRSLRSELASGLEGKAPSYYLLDIGRGQIEEVRDLVAKAAPGAVLETAPMLRGRLVELDGVPVERIKPPEEARWVLSGDRGLTFAEAAPKDSRIVEGAWWPAGHEGEALVSFDVELAGLLGLKVGSTVTVNVLGRNVTARIANLRTIEWESLAINFVMIFSPSTLEKAPYNFLATLTYEEEPSLAGEGRFVQSLVEGFPNVTAVRVKDAIAAINGILERVLAAARIASAVTLLAGAIVLAGALATAEQRRTYQAVVLKALGARRRQILLLHLAEYAMIALSVAVAAVLAASAAAYAVTTFVMDVRFVFDPWAVAQALTLALTVMLAFGLRGTLRVLRARPMSFLKAEQG